MQWSATDQFGNLNTADSDATTMEAFLPHIKSLMEELQARVGDQFQISVDMDYCELAGPTVDHVSHILRAPNLICFGSDMSPEDVRSEIAGLVDQVCAERGIPLVEVRLA